MALSFSRQVDQEFKKFGALASREITASAKGAWKTAVAANDSHVTTGAMRFNWKLSTDRRSSYVPKRLNRPRPNVPKFNFRIRYDKRIYLYNNMPYASLAEDLSPGNMLAKATVFFENDLEARLRKLNRTKL
jgi:hypothetical protein